MKLLVISLDRELPEKLEVPVEKRKRHDMASRLLLHSSYFYIAWRRIREFVYSIGPDVVVIGRTRLGFVLGDLRRNLPFCKLATLSENVEYDYVDAYFSGVGGIRQLFVPVEKFAVYRDEKMAILCSDYLLFLTERDAGRTDALYGLPDGNHSVLPVCVPPAKPPKRVGDRTRVAFIGSLYYAPNAQGALWFLKKVWARYFMLDPDMELLIAGKAPPPELMAAMDFYTNVTVMDGFDKMEDIITANTVLIAPILTGAGMKVKVAESLAVGLPVVASSEALVGYEAALESEDAACPGLVRADMPGEYAHWIRYFSALDDSGREEVRRRNQERLAAHYSPEAATRIVSDMLDILLD